MVERKDQNHRFEHSRNHPLLYLFDHIAAILNAAESPQALLHDILVNHANDWGIRENLWKSLCQSLEYNCLTGNSSTELITKIFDSKLKNNPELQLQFANTIACDLSPEYGACDFFLLYLLKKIGWTEDTSSALNEISETQQVFAPPPDENDAEITVVELDELETWYEGMQWQYSQPEEDFLDENTGTDIQLDTVWMRTFVRLGVRFEPSGSNVSPKYTRLLTDAEKMQERNEQNQRRLAESLARCLSRKEFKEIHQRLCYLLHDKGVNRDLRNSLKDILDVLKSGRFTAAEAAAEIVLVLHHADDFEFEKVTSIFSQVDDLFKSDDQE